MKLIGNLIFATQLGSINLCIVDRDHVPLMDDEAVREGMVMKLQATIDVVVTVDDDGIAGVANDVALMKTSNTWTSMMMQMLQVNTVKERDAVKMWQLTVSLQCVEDVVVVVVAADYWAVVSEVVNRDAGGMRAVAGKPAVFVPQYKVPAEELLGNGPFDGEALLLPVPCLKLLSGGNGGGGVLELAWETLAVAVQLGEKCLGSVGIFCRYCFITLNQRWQILSYNHLSCVICFREKRYEYGNHEFTKNASVLKQSNKVNISYSFCIWLLSNN
uniref:Uncharacterized protein n=1 Tax=Glossina pallidipes TaxID=7398 RepID=A0A1B0AAT0_GLOPL